MLFQILLPDSSWRLVIFILANFGKGNPVLGLGLHVVVLAPSVIVAFAYSN